MNNRVMTIEPEIGHRVYGNRNPRGAAMLSGLGALGDDSSTLSALGFSPGQVQQILQAHTSGALSDAGYQVILNGSVDPTQLADFLNSDPGAPASGSAGTLQAGVPTGSTIVYQAQWDSSAVTRSAQDVLNLVLQQLGQFGLAVMSSSAQTGISNLLKAATITDYFFSVSIQLRVTGPGFAQAQDVAAIVDHAAYSVTGHMPVSSSASVTAVPGSGSSLSDAGSSLVQFIEQNMGTIFLGLAALVILPQIARKL
jgi:hypothetical protein